MRDEAEQNTTAKLWMLVRGEVVTPEASLSKEESHSSPAPAAASAPRSRARSHDAGASVGLASRRGDDLGLERGLGLACDVRDPDAVDAAVAATVERFGGLDIVVANAGVGAYGPFLELSREHLEEMVDTNLKGTLYAIRAGPAPPPEERRRRRDHPRLRGGPARAPLRGGLLRVEVRPGRLHARARPRAPRAGRPLHERLPGRRRHRVRARRGPRPDAGRRCPG